MNWRFDAVDCLDVKGIFWQMLAPRWSFDPLSGAGAARAGGRWNETGQPALYLSDSHATAIAEYHQDLPRPGTLTGYEVVGSFILDISHPTARKAIGLEDELLRWQWKWERDIAKRRPLNWDVARAASDRGCHGLRVPSAQAPGINLVLWRWNLPGTPSVRFIDPIRDLPKDQTSWKS